MGLQGEPYSLDHFSMGWAIIINNVVDERPGRVTDASALVQAFQTMGFNVDLHEGLSKKV